MNDLDTVISGSFSSSFEVAYDVHGISTRRNEALQYIAAYYFCKVFMRQTWSMSDFLIKNELKYVAQYAHCPLQVEWAMGTIQINPTKKARTNSILQQILKF